MRRWTATALAGCLAAVAVGGGCRGVAPLRVGMTGGRGPLLERTEEGWQGAEADFAMALGERLGREVVVRAYEGPEALKAGVLADEVDLGMGGLRVRPEWQGEVEFSPPYLVSGWMLLTRRGEEGEWTTPGRLQGAKIRVAAKKGSEAAAFAKTYLPGAEWVAASNGKRGAEKVKAGEADAYLGEAPEVLQAWRESGGTTGVAPLLLERWETGWVYRPGNGAMRTATREAMAEWSTDGTAGAILGRWLPVAGR